MQCRPRKEATINVSVPKSNTISKTKVRFSLTNASSSASTVTSSRSTSSRSALNITTQGDGQNRTCSRFEQTNRSCGDMARHSSSSSSSSTSLAPAIAGRQCVSRTNNDCRRIARRYQLLLTWHRCYRAATARALVRSAIACMQIAQRRR